MSLHVFRSKRNIYVDSYGYSNFEIHETLIMDVKRKQREMNHIPPCDPLFLTVNLTLLIELMYSFISTYKTLQIKFSITKSNNI